MARPLYPQGYRSGSRENASQPRLLPASGAQMTIRDLRPYAPRSPVSGAARAGGDGCYVSGGSELL